MMYAVPLMYPWWPRLSGGCSTCMEQSATSDSGLLLTFDSPEGDQVSLFSSVIWLTWCRLLRWSADVCIELCNSFISKFCKMPPQLCDGSTVIHDICSSSSSKLSHVCRNVAAVVVDRAVTTSDVSGYLSASWQLLVQRHMPLFTSDRNDSTDCSWRRFIDR